MLLAQVFHKFQITSGNFLITIQVCNFISFAQRNMKYTPRGNKTMKSLMNFRSQFVAFYEKLSLHFHQQKMSEIEFLKMTFEIVMALF